MFKIVVKKKQTSQLQRSKQRLLALPQKSQKREADNILT